MNSGSNLLFYDTETCGLYSMCVLIQYAEGPDGDIHLYEVWRNPVKKTLELIEWMCEHVMIGFNLSFDHFHIQKLHAIWSKLDEMGYEYPDIEVVASIEKSCTDCLCLKPYSALDLLLHSRKGPYQSLMARKEVRIKRIPLTPVEWEGQTIPMAYAVANYLERTIELNGIYFAKRADHDAPRWTVMDREIDGDNGPMIDRKLADVVLKFHPDGSLKSLAEHALGVKPKYVHSDIEIDKKLRPQELGFAPYAEAVSSKEEDWKVYDKEGKFIGYAWPGVIRHHIEHWTHNEPAREYANDDIVYTRGLYYHFNEPKHGDTDSVLACMVASVRWRGFEIDIEGIKELKAKAVEVVKNSPINTNRPIEIREYIFEMCDDTEMLILEETTKKAKLEQMSQMLIEEDEECMKCLMEGCPRCNFTGTLKKGKHPAAGRAKEILDIKIAKKEIELYDKLLIAGKFHASFTVIGTLSSRMAGADKLNAQGIKSDPIVRSKFPLKSDGYVLCGGDFASFEVTIADAIYNDPDFRKAIVTGKKLHAIFGSLLFPEYDYDEILRSDKHPDEYPFGNMYTKGKSCVFARLYFGNASTYKRNFEIPLENGEHADKEWDKIFPNMGASRKKIVENYQPLIQDGGIGTAITWREPQEYIESFLGFRRYFTLEYKIVKALFQLAQSLPSEWRKANTLVQRSQHRGAQKAWGALTSALYGAAFGVAEACVRAAGNHIIQSPGAQITKELEVKIWGLQPAGVHKFVVAPMNIHDEVMSVTDPDYVEKEAEIVEEVVESFRDKVPLIGMDWCKDMDNWSEKKGGHGEMLYITYNKEKVLEDLEALTC